MDYSKRWKKLGDLGIGGQGQVHRVLDLSKINETNMYERLGEALRVFAGITTPGQQRDAFSKFRELVLQLQAMEDPANLGALKVLLERNTPQRTKVAEERIKREIVGMRSIEHPNLLRLLDTDPDGRWFVTQFYPRGTLAGHLKKREGDFLSALQSIRPLVEAVRSIHTAGMVHRDIKPENVFIGPQDELILGDFGLVLLAEPSRERLSETFENVGSRDWMPPWAMGMKLADVHPSFDVFSLGKLLWAMVSGSPRLQLWYFDRPQFDVERKFPNGRGIECANALFRKCIAEEEADVLQDAGKLLEEIDRVLAMIEGGGEPLAENRKRRCRVCGLGHFEVVVRAGDINIGAFGLKPIGDNSFRIYACNQCGHIQLFRSRGKQMLPAWHD